MASRTRDNHGSTPLPHLPTVARSTPELMEILVVEDEVRLAQHISRALTEAGHEPVMVHDGETALGESGGRSSTILSCSM